MPVIAEYADLRLAIAARRKELGLSQVDLDNIAEVQPGYTAKLECGLKNFGEKSLPAILGALGLVLSPTKHGETPSETWGKAREREKDLKKKHGQKGGRARLWNTTPEQRRAIARKAAKSRWRNWRLVKAEQKRKAKRSNRKRP